MPPAASSGFPSDGRSPVACGGVVLCGGKSTRMGRPKAWLPFGDELMLQRVVRILGEVVSPIVVVAAREQTLPDLPDTIRVLRDEQEALGPLAGLAVGLAGLQGAAEAAYVSACDAPLLRPAFVRRMIDELADYDLAIPRDGTYHHPLAAVYRTRLAPAVGELIAVQRLRPLFLVQQSRSREVDVESLRSADPDLASLRNTNTPEEYAAALRDAGLVSGDLCR
ncbi:MAG: molybdenum cofactor guanylyltransferase [Planctomycetaceae bacterium]